MRMRRFDRVDKNKVLQTNFQNFSKEQEESIDAEYYAQLGFIQEGLKQKGVDLSQPIPNMGDTPDRIATSFQHAVEYTLAHRSQRIDLFADDSPEQQKNLRKFARKMSDVLGGSLTNDQVLSGLQAYCDFGRYSKQVNEARQLISAELGRDHEITYVSEYVDKHISMMDRIKAFSAEVKSHFKNFGKDEENKFSMGEAITDTIGVFGLAASGAVKIIGGESGKMRVDDKVEAVKNKAVDAFDAVANKVDDKVNAVKSKVADTFDTVVNKVDDKIDVAKDYASSKISSAQEKGVELAEKMAVLKEKTVNFFPNLANVFKKRIQEVAENAVELKNKVVQSVNDGIDKTVEMAQAVKDKTVETVTDGVQAVVDAKNKTVEVAHSVKDKAVEAVADGVDSVKQVFVGDKQQHLANIRDFLEKRDAVLASKNTNKGPKIG